MAAVEGGGVRGADRVQEVSGGVDPGAAGAQGGVDEGAAGAGVEVEAAVAGEFVVGDPVSGEDDRVAVDGAAGAGVEVFDLDGFDAGTADDADQPGAVGDGGAEEGARGEGECRRCPGVPVGSEQQGDPAARAVQGEGGGPAHGVGSDDDRAAAHGAAGVQVEGVLELSGGEDSGGPVAGEEAGGAGAFAGAGGEDDDTGPDPEAALGAGDVDGGAVGGAVDGGGGEI